MQRVKTVREKVARHGSVFVSSLLLGLVQAQQVLAAGGFPTADVKGKSLAEAGNWLNVIRIYVGQGGVIIGLALSILAFVWVGYSALTKFNEARQGRAEWSELAVLAVAGAVILIFIAILLSQTQTATTGLESTVGT